MQHQKSSMPPDLKKWLDAKQRFRLSQKHVCMAMELGLNPRKMSGYASNPHEQWKAPLPDFIESIYEKRFGQTRKPVVRSFVQIAESRKKRKAPKQPAKAAQQVSEPAEATSAVDPTYGDNSENQNASDASLNDHLNGGS